jgi:hypothetical protein
MRKLLLFATLFALIFASCKKDNSASQPKNLLDKVVSKQGADSTVTTYNYNSQNKYIGESAIDVSGGTTSNNSRVITRDNLGRITKITDSEATPGTASTSTFTDYFYLGASDIKMKHGLFTFPQGSTTIRDSAAYTYTGNFVSRVSHFWSTPTFPVTQIYYYEFKYDTKGNMTEFKSFSDNSPGSGNFQLQGTATFTYDDKINPLYTNDPALVEYVDNQYVSPNNVTRLNYVATNSANSFNLTVAYEYRSDGRPTKATASVAGFTSVSTYSYK